MKKIIKYILFLAIVATFSSCMDDVADFTVKGEAITGFELNSPDNNSKVLINKGTLSETYTFSWGAAESGLGSAIKYTILFDLPEGDFSNPIWSKVSDESGAASKVTLTYDELQQIYTIAGATEMATVKWNVKAENGSANVTMGQVANTLSVSLSTAGIASFSLVEPLDKSILQFDGTKESEMFAFDWNDALATSGNVTYKFYLDQMDGDFSNPLLTIDSDAEGTESKLSMTHAEWKALLEQNNIAEGSFIWTVKAIGSDLEWMKEIFEVYIEFVNWRKPIFIVGEATNADWDISKALELNFVSPNIWVGTFELKAGKDFKFFPQTENWDNGIGTDRFENFIGCTGMDYGNIRNDGATDGYYLVVVDLNTKTITVSDAPKILGGSVIADWNTDNAVKAQMVSPGVYDTYQYITTDGYGFKFVPQYGSWDGAFGKSKTVDGLMVQSDADNMSVPADGFYRVRANFNDMTYSVVETSWGIIGSGSPGGWDDDTNMTIVSNVKGEYKWTADITLTDGEIKFRANDGWDINLGDSGANGSLENGGDNIAVTAGNYHIELILNSATGFTYSITAN